MIWIQVHLIAVTLLLIVVISLLDQILAELRKMTKDKENEDQ